MYTFINLYLINVLIIEVKYLIILQIIFNLTFNLSQQLLVFQHILVIKLL